MLSKIEAVNQLLDAIGEDPVTSLDNENYEDLDAAIRHLDRVSREVQAKGWHRNTEYGYKLSPDLNKRIPLPDNVLRIDTAKTFRGVDVTQRSLNDFTYLYNLTDKTFTFDTPIEVEVVWLLDFEDLTPELQMYIAAKAAKEYQMSVLKAQSVDRFLRAKEMEAYAGALDAESELSDANSLRDNPRLYRMTHRYNPYRGY